jgi:hypothetical protein
MIGKSLFNVQENKMDIQDFIGINKYYSVPRRYNDLFCSPMRLAKSFDPTRMYCDKLSPCEKSDSRPNTLSSMFGLDSFPPHTDFALDHLPPRYILLYAPRPRIAKTVLFDVKDLLSAFDESTLSRSLFLVCGFKKRFYCNLVTHGKSGTFFRYNQAIMSPVNQEAKEVENYIHNDWKPSLAVDWNINKIVIIDNWLMLHSRTRCSEGDKNTVLWRLSLGVENQLESR